MAGKWKREGRLNNLTVAIADLIVLQTRARAGLHLKRRKVGQHTRKDAAAHRPTRRSDKPISSRRRWSGGSQIIHIERVDVLDGGNVKSEKSHG
jgi:hypothetical protein